VSTSELVSAVRDAPTLMVRFRILNARIEQTRSLEQAALEQLLDLFGSDWARRRVLLALFRVGLPIEIEQAIALVGRLESRSARRWCAGTLRARRELTEQEQAALDDCLERPYGPPAL